MLTLEMLISLHKRSPNKVNLAYKKPGGSIGYCYIDPTKTLTYAHPHINTGKPTLGGKCVEHMHLDTKILQNTISKDQCFYSFYKQNSHAMIWVRLADVEFQNKNREEMLKLIYVD